MDTLPNPYGLTFEETAARCGGREPARAYWQSLHRPAPTATAAAPAAFPEVLAHASSQDGHTEKFLLRVGHGADIETVLMRYGGRTGGAAAPRHTACLSTQAGCAMGCVFCATGQRGFARHLTVGEIVSQVAFLNSRLARTLPATRLRNLVFMGMGEPLHNADAVLRAAAILSDPRGAAIAPRHITLSTVGWVPGILRLVDERSPLRLAVSLHGADDAERNALVPAGRRWPLAELMDACRRYARVLRRKVLFEWTLIAGRNDGLDTASRLAGLLAGLPCQVNLIPLNRTEAYDGAPSQSDAIAAFRAVLAAAGIPSSVRQRRGVDIAAGCGQLRPPL